MRAKNNNQFSSVAQLCPALCDTMDCGTPGFPVLHQLACSDSCPSSQWCHPTISSCRSLLLLSSIFPSIRVFSNQSVFRISGQSIGVPATVSVLPMNIQDWIPLGWTGLNFLQSKELSRVFSNTTVQKHQFFGAQLSLWFNSRIHTWPLEKP